MNSYFMTNTGSDFFSDYFQNVGYGFSRPFYESKGWYAKEKDGKTFVVVNVLGINEKDIDVFVDSTDNPNKQQLSVSGKTHNELLDKDFSVNVKFLVSHPMKEVVKSFENGLLILEIEYDEPVKPNVSIRGKLN